MLEVLTLKESDKWDQIVKTFKDYDVYYLSGYSKGFYIHGDGEPLLFYYEDSEVKGINVVIKRDIAKEEKLESFIEKDKYFDLTSPYGYGGWIIEGAGNIDNLINEYTMWCKEHGIISEVTRFHPILQNQEKVRNEYNVMDLGKTISMSLDSEELIWNNIHSKNRNVIRKAMKNNVVIKKDNSKECFDVFMNIYNQTMNRDNAENYYYFKEEFYDSIRNDLMDNVDVYYAEYDNKVIASSIILKANNRLSYHLSGSLREYGSLAATNLLLYEVALWGSKNGYKTFHLGGGLGSKEDNLFAFKRAFNKNEDYQYSIGRRIFNQEIYDKLVSYRDKSTLRDKFFPLYRA